MPSFFVTVNLSEPQQEAGPAAEAADDVIRGTERDVRVQGLRALRQQFLGVLVRLFNHFQGVEMFLLKNAVRVGFHSGGNCQGKKALPDLSDVQRGSLWQAYARS